VRNALQCASNLTLHSGDCNRMNRHT